MQNLFHDGGYSMMGMMTPLLHLIHGAMDEESLRKAGFSEKMIERTKEH